MWAKILDPNPDPAVPPIHVHRCPECYEHPECSGACDLEPDLECADGTPAGAYITCERCGPPRHEHECIDCQEDVSCTDSRCLIVSIGDDLERPRSPTFMRCLMCCRILIDPDPRQTTMPWGKGPSCERLERDSLV